MTMMTKYIALRDHLLTLIIVVLLLCFYYCANKMYVVPKPIYMTHERTIQILLILKNTLKLLSQTQNNIL